MRLPDESDLQGEINLVPMIDVIFSILAFFVLSTLFLTRSEGLEVNLPSAQTAEIQKISQINVTIKPNGDIFLDRQPIQLEALKSAVESKIAPEQTGMVIINADEKVSHGIVIKVMDRLRQVENTTLAIAATKEN